MCSFSQPPAHEFCPQSLGPHARMQLATSFLKRQAAPTSGDTTAALVFSAQQAHVQSSLPCVPLMQRWIVETVLGTLVSFHPP